MAMLTSEQFERTRKLALRLAGIELFDRHRELLATRGRRFWLPHAAGIEVLLDAAEEGDSLASQQLIGLFTTNYTAFFRHPPHFKIAAEHAQRAVLRRGGARLWSAAAATGEEPYSMAMALVETMGGDDPPLTILATDIDADALAVAAQGEYGEKALQVLTPEQCARFFQESAGAGLRRIAPSARRLVTFHELNLASSVWPSEEPFDVIFCRNVLMYLEARLRHSVVERLASLLQPDGLLLIDPAEHLGQAGHLFAQENDAVYRRKSTSLCTRHN